MDSVALTFGFKKQTDIALLINETVKTLRLLLDYGKEPAQEYPKALWDRTLAKRIWTHRNAPGSYPKDFVPETECPNKFSDSELDIISRKIEYIEETLDLSIMTSDSAVCSPFGERIYLPWIGAFNSKNDFFHVLFHELAHWTGSPLSRVLSGEKFSEDWNKEELIAELASLTIGEIVGTKTKYIELIAYQYMLRYLYKIESPKRIEVLLSAADSAKEAVQIIFKEIPLLFSESDLIGQVRRPVPNPVKGCFE